MWVVTVVGNMGQPGRKPRVTPADALGVFEGRDDRAEPLTSNELAEVLNCSRKTAFNKLTELEDAGDVVSKKVGGRSRVWWVPLRGAESPVTGSSDSPGSHQADHTDIYEDAITGREPDESERDEPDALEAALADLETTDRRREAVRACVEYLREAGSAQRRDFIREVYPDHPAGYGSEGGWWNRIGKEYLRDVAEKYDRIHPPPGEGSHIWEYPR